MATNPFPNYRTSFRVIARGGPYEDSQDTSVKLDPSVTERGKRLLRGEDEPQILLEPLPPHTLVIRSFPAKSSSYNPYRRAYVKFHGERGFHRLYRDYGNECKNEYAAKLSKRKFLFPFFTPSGKNGNFYGDKNRIKAYAEYAIREFLNPKEKPPKFVQETDIYDYVRVDG